MQSEKEKFEKKVSMEVQPAVTQKETAFYFELKHQFAVQCLVLRFVPVIVTQLGLNVMQFAQNTSEMMFVCLCVSMETSHGSFLI